MIQPVTGPMSVSIIMPVMDETDSLRKTVHMLLDGPRADLHEILCITSKFSTPQAMEVCHELKKAYPELINIQQQTKPYLGGALQDAFDSAKGRYILLMASDLETDPAVVKPMIEKAREGWDIVATTRWKQGGSFRGYNPVKFILNFLFQKIVGTMYGTKLSDLTYGYRIYRSELLRGHNWSELRHPFLLECVLRPLLRGASATELPVHWIPRPEGESHNTFWRNFLYFRIAWKLRFTSEASRNLAPASGNSQI